MARLAVRQAFEAEVQNFLNAQIPVVPFHDSINWASFQITDDLWVTAEFSAYMTDALCYEGGKRMESGSVDFLIFNKAGQGMTPAIQLGDALADHFFTFRQGGISVQNTIGPNEYTDGRAHGRYYGVIVSVEFDYYY